MISSAAWEMNLPVPRSKPGRPQCILPKGSWILHCARKLGKGKLQINKHLRAVECLFIRNFFPLTQKTGPTPIIRSLLELEHTCRPSDKTSNLTLHRSFLPFFLTKYQALQQEGSFQRTEIRAGSQFIITVS